MGHYLGRRNRYRTVSIPEGLYILVLKYVERGLYGSVSQFVCEAIRRRLEELGEELRVATVSRV